MAAPHSQASALLLPAGWIELFCIYFPKDLIGMATR
jgi:hypothetical protein